LKDAAYRRTFKIKRQKRAILWETQSARQWLSSTGKKADHHSPLLSQQSPISRLPFCLCIQRYCTIRATPKSSGFEVDFWAFAYRLPLQKLSLYWECLGNLSARIQSD
jgi:hypothetical protein